LEINTTADKLKNTPPFPYSKAKISAGAVKNYGILYLNKN